MNKTISSICVTVAVLVMALPGAAFADYYYPATAAVSSPICPSLTYDVSYGISGTEVAVFQQFLMTRGYLQIPAATGYFGVLTQNALIRFQTANNLPRTGIADAATRSVIQSLVCGSSQQTVVPPPYNPNGNGYYPPVVQPTGAVFISSLSTNVAQIGAYVTIYGTGFDQYSNTVNFGGGVLTGLPSPNGTSISFTVPQTMPSSCVSSTYVYNYNSQNCYNSSVTLTVQSGMYPISVTNSRGISNSIPFTVTSYNNYGNGYYNYNTGTPVISYLTPISGNAGTYVTIYGSNFTPTGNTVYFNNIPVQNVTSYNGTSLSFAVPTTNIPVICPTTYPYTSYDCSNNNNGSQYVSAGTYNVYVTNASGYSSNTLQFTLNSSGYNGYGNYGQNAQIVSTNGPTFLGINSPGMYTVTTNDSSSYVKVLVNWGDNSSLSGSQMSQISYTQGQQSFTFSHSYSLAGTYLVTFTAIDSAGYENTSSVSVSVSGYNNSGYNTNINLYSLSPMQGYVGTQIILQGSGFSSYGNTIHFGTGGIENVSSNGSTLYFTVPSTLTPCSVSSNSVCPLYAQSVTTGSYPVYVTNTSGQISNTLYFSVI